MRAALKLSPADVPGWRKDTRRELIERRQLITSSLRHDASDLINASIEHVLMLPAGAVVGFCWPYEGEVDVRFAIRTLRGRGAIAALPAVTAKGAPLEFRVWWPGAVMQAGALGIPFPQDSERVTPQAALVPVVGFDAKGYRLGYGGGYFDRTLATLTVKPITIGIGFEYARLTTIYPQPYDIPMDLVMTESGIHVAGVDGLEPIGADSAAEYVRRQAAERGLW